MVRRSTNPLNRLDEASQNESFVMLRFVSSFGLLRAFIAEPWLLR